MFEDRTLLSATLMAGDLVVLQETHDSESMFPAEAFLRIDPVTGESTHLALPGGNDRVMQFTVNSAGDIFYLAGELSPGSLAPVGTAVWRIGSGQSQPSAASPHYEPVQDSDLVLTLEGLAVGPDGEIIVLQSAYDPGTDTSTTVFVRVDDTGEGVFLAAPEPGEFVGDFVVDAGGSIYYLAGTEFDGPFVPMTSVRRIDFSAQGAPTPPSTVYSDQDANLFGIALGVNGEIFALSNEVQSPDSAPVDVIVRIESLTEKTDIAVLDINEYIYDFVVESDGSIVYVAEHWPMPGFNGSRVRRISPPGEEPQTITTIHTTVAPSTEPTRNLVWISVVPEPVINQPPTLDAIGNLEIWEDAGEQTIVLTGITPGPPMPAENNQSIIAVWAEVWQTDSPGLITGLDVDYDDTNGGASTGVLRFTPADDAFGTATIRVYVQDDGGTDLDGQDTFFREFTVTVLPVNDPPTLDPLADLVLLDMDGLGEQTVDLTGISPGPDNEGSQGIVEVRAETDNPDLITGLTVDYDETNGGASSGVLRFTPAAGLSGTATITVFVQDDGDTERDGDDTVSRSFTVKVLSAGEVVVVENPFGIGDREVANVQTGLTLVLPSGYGYEDVQLVAPDPLPAGVSAELVGSDMLVVTFPADFQGDLQVQTTVSDGAQSETQPFTVSVLAVNAPPTLDAISNREVWEDAGEQTVSLTGIGPGLDEGHQAIIEIWAEVWQTDTPGLITGLSVDYDYANGGASGGVLRFTPADDAFGEATVRVYVQDDGGTAVGGQNTFFREFTVRVLPVNDPPTLGRPDDIELPQGLGQQTVELAGITPGPANEGDQKIVAVWAEITATDVPDLLTGLAVEYDPQGMASTGLLRFTPAADLVGTATITVFVRDDGGLDRDGIDTVSRTFTVTVLPAVVVDDLANLSDLQISHNQGVLRLVLPARDAGGVPIDYAAELVGVDPLEMRAFQLNQELGLEFTGDYLTNWAGVGEKWLQSVSGTWYFITPTGHLHQWTGVRPGVHFLAVSPLIEKFDASYHLDPSMLHSAVPPAGGGEPNADGTLAENVLTISWQPDFVGDVLVQITAEHGQQVTQATFTVSIVNAPPVLEIGDRSVSQRQGTLEIVLPEFDADGDALFYTAGLLTADPLEQLAWELKQSLGLRFTGGDWTNWGGAGEKWMQGNGNAWYFITPEGNLHLWTGTRPGARLVASSPLVATLDAGFHADPSRLHGATEPTAGPVDGDPVSLNGNVLTITPPSGFLGRLHVWLTADDGLVEVTETFAVTVMENHLPVLEIPDWEMSQSDGELVIDLSDWASDADGDPLTFEAELVLVDPLEVLAWDLKQSLGLSFTGDYAANWGGAGEKWMQSASQTWYFITPEGNLHEWTGVRPGGNLVARSPLAAVLDPSFHADPSKLHNAVEPVPGSPDDAALLLIEPERMKLRIVPDETFTGVLRIRVTADDGLATVSQMFRVTVTEAAEMQMLGGGSFDEGEDGEPSEFGDDDFDAVFGSLDQDEGWSLFDPVLAGE